MICAQDEALEAVNRVLVALGGQELESWPLGVPGDPEDCPVARPIRQLCPSATVLAGGISVPRPLAPIVARALGVPVPWWRMYRATVRVTNPECLMRTIIKFDELELADLIDRELWRPTQEMADA